jgi:hypothetical protein
MFARPLARNRVLRTVSDHAWAHDNSGVTPESRVARILSPIYEQGCVRLRARTYRSIGQAAYIQEASFGMIVD